MRIADLMPIATGICTTWRILSHWDNLPACPTYMMGMNASYFNNVNVCATSMAADFITV